MVRTKQSIEREREREVVTCAWLPYTYEKYKRKGLAARIAAIEISTVSLAAGWTPMKQMGHMYFSNTTHLTHCHSGHVVKFTHVDLDRIMRTFIYVTLL